jgi:hypothetical protein
MWEAVFEMVMTTEPLPPQPWHAVAFEMKAQGKTLNDIAAAVDREMTTVRKLLNPNQTAYRRRKDRERQQRLRDRRKAQRDASKQSRTGGIRSSVQDVAQGAGA